MQRINKELSLIFLFHGIIFLQASLWADDLLSNCNRCDGWGDCADPCGNGLCCYPPPRNPWYFQADAMFMKRDAGKSLPVATISNSIPPNGELWDIVAFSTGDLDSPFRAGAKALVGRTIGDTRWQIDFTYFWLDSWNDSSVITDSTSNPTPPGGQGNLFSPFSNFGEPTAIDGFDYNNLMSIREVSQLQNGELNLRYLLPMPHDCLTAKFLLGVRYMSINEQFDYNSQSQATGSASYISTLTRNSLVGPQLGGDFYFFAYQQCWINFEFKGAICANQTLQDTNGTRAIGVNETPLGSSDTSNPTSFVGDLNLMLVWQLRPRLITRIGYQAIWVTNVAMARRNYDPPASILLNDTPFIDTNGNVVYHGPHIGLEFTW
ncbi:MAG TPA: BBP7 family outer membrane beta-barrel protein [Thermoguttaceae bacterium]